jgi:hypothetical protein
VTFKLTRYQQFCLLAVGAGFLIAFFLANSPVVGEHPPEEPAPSEPARGAAEEATTGVATGSLRER